MPSASTTFRFGEAEDRLIQDLQDKLRLRSRTDVIRTALALLDREMVRREERVDGLLRGLEQRIPAFERNVVDEAGFDPRRERAFARVDNVTYIETPGRPLIFAERVREDGTTEKTLVEEGGENPEKRVWIEPVRFE